MKLRRIAGVLTAALLLLTCLPVSAVTVTETESGYHIPGNQTYQPKNLAVEGDFSQAAFRSSYHRNRKQGRAPAANQKI